MKDKFKLDKLLEAKKARCLNGGQPDLFTSFGDKSNSYSSGPVLGNIEFAGWVPGGQQMLMARETRIAGRMKRSFEVARMDTLTAEKQASDPGLLVAFGKWQDPSWKRQTVSLR